MIDEALFEEAIERERRLKRRDRLWMGAGLAVILVLPFFGLFSLMEVDHANRWRYALLAAPGFVLLIGAVVYAVGRLGSGTAMAFLNPGRSGSVISGFSHAEAMAAAGQLTEASHAFEAWRATHGELADSLRVEANLHLGPGGDVDRAKELLQRLRKAPDSTRADELFATHRLIDLYLGPLQDRDRGMSELRRLAERFPGTRDAEGALAALDDLRLSSPPDEHSS